MKVLIAICILPVIMLTPGMALAGKADKAANALERFEESRDKIELKIENPILSDERRQELEGKLDKIINQYENKWGPLNPPEEPPPPATGLLLEGETLRLGFTFGAPTCCNGLPEAFATIHFPGTNQDTGGPQPSQLETGELMTVAFFDDITSTTPFHTDSFGLYSSFQHIFSGGSDYSQWADGDGAILITMVTGSVDIDSVQLSYYDSNGFVFSSPLVELPDLPALTN